MSASRATLRIADGVATITLNRPERHNALVPDLLEDLRTSIARAADADIGVLVLTGAGRSFSTGGDIAGFLAARDSREGIAGYAGRIVGLLNEAILDLIGFKAPVVAAVNGPVTGGSAGLVFAADIVLMSEAAFLQPYYGEVGFAPDGGWTALLPDRIGAARAIEVQALNRRIDARTAVDLGLATRVVSADAMDAAVAETVAAICAKEPRSLAAARRLVWDEPCRALLAARLEAERTAFVDLVGREEVAGRMRTFVARA